MPSYEQWSQTFDDRMPIYRQIILQFNRSFIRGEIEPGERIPSIREIAALLKVNTNTVQRVYQQMERDGLISSRRGTGYFFTEDRQMIEETRKSMAQDTLLRFITEMRALGYTDKDIIGEVTEQMEGEKHNDTGT